MKRVTDSSLPATGDAAARVDEGLRFGDGLVVEEADLVERFVRAPGPGGQNVNKVETAVQLRFDAAGSRSLPAPVRTRLLALAGRRATNAGEIVIEAHRFRTRERNRADARERLLDLLRRAATAPKPRRPTRPTRGSVERRLDAKRRRSTIKKSRGSSTEE